MMCPKPKPKQIFTLPSFSLPSQYRSLLPVTDVEVQRIMKIERRSRRMRNILLALTTLIFLLVVIIVAVIVAFQLSMDEMEKPVLFSESKHIVLQGLYGRDEGEIVSESHKSSSYRYQSLQMERGTRCNGKCLEFAAFRFKATCDNGMCRCHGDNYDDVTCLPHFGDCHIEIFPASQFLLASHQNSTQTIFGCKAKKHQNFNEITPERSQDLPVAKKTINAKDMQSSPTEPSSSIYRKSQNSRKNFTTMADLDSSKTTKAMTSFLPSPKSILFTGNPKQLMGNPKAEVGNTKDNMEKHQKFPIIPAQTHVISLYSNEHTSSTRLILTSSKAVKMFLVLASYEPVTWNVKTGLNVTLEQVVVISNHWISRAEVFISSLQPTNPDTQLKQPIQSPRGNKSHDPFSQSEGKPITRLMMRTGYGNDKMSGNTPQMLKSITDRIGPVQAFVGVAHADLIQCDVDQFIT